MHKRSSNPRPGLIASAAVRAVALILAVLTALAVVGAVHAATVPPWSGSGAAAMTTSSSSTRRTPADGNRYLVQLRAGLTDAEFRQHLTWAAATVFNATATSGPATDGDLPVVDGGSVSSDDPPRTRWRYRGLVHTYNIRPRRNYTSGRRRARLSARAPVTLVAGKDPAPIRGYAAVLRSARAVALLRARPEVAIVERDAPVKLNGWQGTPWVQVGNTVYQAPLPAGGWGLARISARSKPAVTATSAGQYAFMARAGVGVDVYVLDTGVFQQHSDFGGRAILGVNLVNEADGDLNGHGTFVASVMAGTNYGVAKNANIIDVKVLNAAGSGFWSTVVAAINWVVNRATSTGRPSIINMSISGDFSTFLNNAITAATQANVHVVVAAGNSAADACVKSPSSCSAAVVVGSMSRLDTISSFSNYGNCVTLFAPGEAVLGASTVGVNASKLMSGTSMAAPQAAGVIAQLLAQFNVGVPLTKEYLVRTATTAMLTGLPANSTSPNAILYSDPGLLTLANASAVLFS
ncbi:subtilisin-like serine protease [Allomyces javanicus]|nr:subtilisin-like serine protease [Allomyces javanicus]